jgi:hypothetical protein
MSSFVFAAFCILDSKAEVMPEKVIKAAKNCNMENYGKSKHGGLFEQLFSCKVKGLF